MFSFIRVVAVRSQCLTAIKTLMETNVSLLISEVTESHVVQ